VFLPIAWLLLGAGKPAAKPQVELKATPMMAMIPIGGSPAIVRFQLIVKDNGDEGFYCPRVEWEWENGTQSVEESDCPPFDKATPTDHQASFRRSHEFWEPGKHLIQARLYKSDKLIRKVEISVEVRGESTPAYMRSRDE
jgi:hypothetical protein